MIRDDPHCDVLDRVGRLLEKERRLAVGSEPRSIAWAA